MNSYTLQPDPECASTRQWPTYTAAEADHTADFFGGLACDNPNHRFMHDIVGRYEWVDKFTHDVALDNPRYLAYCRATGGLTPDATRARDCERWPYVPGAGFLLWGSQAARAWRSQTRHVGPLDHDRFDAWLAQQDGIPDPAAAPYEAQVSFFGELAA